MQYSFLQYDTNYEIAPFFLRNDMLEQIDPWSADAYQHDDLS